MPIQLRFVTGAAVGSDLIRLYEDFPFSHVEAVTPEGTYLGALAVGGVQARPSDYDRGTATSEKFVTLIDATTDQGDKFYSYLKAKIGTPYDYEAIVGFAARANLHQPGHVICSALQTLALRACGYFPTRLAVPAHEISPRDLGLLVSSRVPF